MTVVCSEASPITTTVSPAPISVGQMTSGHQDVVLQPKVIMRATLRDFAGFMHLSQ